MNSLIDEIYRNLTQRQKVVIGRKIVDFKISARVVFTLGIILNELITNAMRHAFKGIDRGRIDISLSLDGKAAILEVSDNGNGLPPSIDIATYSGFGLSLVRELSGQIGGQITVKRKQGTSFILQFEVD
jgi:two-component sensor histidine kinase